MHEKEKIVLIYSGNEVVVERLMANLEKEGIIPIAKDDYLPGIGAGVTSGTPLATELYVIESDFKKAMEIVKAIVEE